MKRRHLSIFSSILAVFLLPSLVLAATIPWVIDTDGNLTISDSGKHYIVTQSSNLPVANWIKVNDGVKTTITLDGVHLINTDKSSVDLGKHKDTKTRIILKEENSLTQRDSSNNVAALRISDGTLRIEGTGSLHASIDNGRGEAAAIGSHHEEAMAGTIVIAGETRIFPRSVAGAGIGSGYEGDMSGKVHLTEAASLHLLGDLGAGIGSGRGGELSGTVQVDGKARVNAFGQRSPALGSGWNGSMSGEIQVGGEAEVSVRAYRVVAIGKGMDHESSRPMTGTIQIADHAKVFVLSGSGAGIGAYHREQFDGEIRLLGNAQLDLKLMHDPMDPRDKPIVIGGGRDFTTEDPHGKYIIEKGVTINEIQADSAEVLVANKLVNIHMVDGVPQNYSSEKPKPPTPPTPPAPQKLVQLPTLVGLRTLRGGKVSIGPVGPQTTGLLEEASSAFSSLQGEVLYEGKLRFVGEEPAQAFVLSFHLGSKYAGKTVQIQQVYRGESQAYTVVISEAGLASVPVRMLGDFAVTVQP